MSINSVEIIPDKQKELLYELQSLLEKQIELARQGNINGIEALSKQAGSLVEKISRFGFFESSEFIIQREQLRKLYQDICLTLIAQQAETTKELRRVRNGKKTVAAYRGNI